MRFGMNLGFTLAPNRTILASMSREPDNKSGAPRKSLDPGAMKTVVAQPQPRSSNTKGILTVASGPEAGKIVPVVAGEMVTLGRADDCTVRFDDTSLSRVHARVMFVMGDYMIGDAGSTNGTFVNGARIAKAQHLEDGDRVELGTDTTLRFSLVTDEEEEALRRIYEGCRARCADGDRQPQASRGAARIRVGLCQASRR